MLEKSPSRLIVNVGGVGYDVQVPLSTFYVLGEPGHARSTLRVHTHVREDVIALYGFATPLEQQLFERLIAHQRHRAEAGAGGALGHRAARISIRAVRVAGRRAADGDSRRRQEDRRADRPGAEGPAAVDAPGDGARGGSAAGGSAARRPAVGAAEPGLPAWAGGKGDREDGEGRDVGFEQALRDVLRALMGGR